MRTRTMWEKFGPAIAAGMAMPSAMGADGKSLPIAPVISGTSAAAAVHTQEVAGSENYKGSVEFRMHKDGDPMLAVQSQTGGRIYQENYYTGAPVPMVAHTLLGQDPIGKAYAPDPVI